MKNTVLVHTQYHENYNVGPEGFGATPHWKPMGGHTFSIELDVDILMYADNVEQIFKQLVERQNTIAKNFEYISHEIQLQEPTILGTEVDFLSIMQSLETV